MSPKRGDVVDVQKIGDQYVTYSRARVMKVEATRLLLWTREVGETWVSKSVTDAVGGFKAPRRPWPDVAIHRHD